MNITDIPHWLVLLGYGGLLMRHRSRNLIAWGVFIFFLGATLEDLGNGAITGFFDDVTQEVLKGLSKVWDQVSGGVKNAH